MWLDERLPVVSCLVSSPSSRCAIHPSRKDGIISERRNNIATKEYRPRATSSRVAAHALSSSRCAIRIAPSTEEGIEEGIVERNRRKESKESKEAKESKESTSSRDRRHRSRRAREIDRSIDRSWDLRASFECHSNIAPLFDVRARAVISCRAMGAVIACRHGSHHRMSPWVTWRYWRMCARIACHVTVTQWTGIQCNGM